MGQNSDTWIRWILSGLVAIIMGALTINFEWDIYQESAIAARILKEDYVEDQRDIKNTLEKLRDGQKELMKAIIRCQIVNRSNENGIKVSEK